MIGIRRIVAATDLSAPSRNAVERGFAIAARGSDVQYTVIHALGAALEASGLTRALGAEVATLARVVRDRQERALRQLAKSAGARQRATAETLVVDGDAGEVIPALAAAAAADLLVIGARGGGGLRRRLFGSTASRLLRRSTCPVLVVRSAVRGPYRQLLVAVDLSPASLQAIRAARQVAPDAILTLLTVWTVPFEGLLHYAGVTAESLERHRRELRDTALRQLHEVAAEAGLAPGSYSLRVEGGAPARVIQQIATGMDADLVACGKHGTHLTEDLLIGSTTLRLVSDLTMDLLVIVDPRRQTPQVPEPVV